MSDDSIATQPPVLLSKLQGGIEQRYDLRVPYAVHEFVSHDTALLEHMTGKPDAPDEVLLIQQQTDSLEFMLFLASEILERADSALSAGQINDDDLDSVCTVVEGVSHAVCLLWHAHNDRQLRPVDMELQAEIDKFVLLSSLVQQPGDRLRLHHRLFERIRIQAARGTSLYDRYKTANDNAANYCGWLNSVYMNAGDENGLSTELARFYRMSGTDKLHHTRQMH